MKLDADYESMLQRRLWLLDSNTVPSCMDDMTLVTGLQRCDPRAVEFVVERFASTLYRFAYYQMNNAAAAEDLVAEVMARVVGRIDGFRLEQATFEAWVFRIARNLIADHYRSRKRKPYLSLEAMMEAQPENEPRQNDPDIQNILDRDQLREGLAALTDEQRQVIVLHVIEGWELPQVARLLDRTIPSVKGLYYRGVQSLRNALIRSDSYNELGG